MFAALLPDRQSVRRRAGVPGDDRRLHAGAARSRWRKRIAVNAFLLLLGSVFVGTYVLEFFGLSVPIVQVAGGIVVCALGLGSPALGATTLARRRPPLRPQRTSPAARSIR